jgi:4,5-DOPA dioxygenase extradiol
MNSQKLPAIFVGHGSPMNAIEENVFTEKWRAIGESLPKIETILCISAHWFVPETLVTAAPLPHTIHDFGGFPDELYRVQYPAPGNPKLAAEICQGFAAFSVKEDLRWGFDHGSWSIMKHIFPQADVPMIQLSINRAKPPVWHFEFGKALSKLREEGVLLVGSGNMVHNLSRAIFNFSSAKGFDWAIHADEIFKTLIRNREHEKLVNYDELGEDIALAVPTPEHYLPLLYVLGAAEANDKISIFSDALVGGSISMTGVGIGF